MNAMKSWRSTLLGLMVLALSSAKSIQFDAAGHLAMTQRDWFTLSCGFLAAYVGSSMVEGKKDGQ
jgi:hypothetical protein